MVRKDGRAGSDEDVSAAGSAEGARRATGADPEGGRKGGRFSTQRKLEAVLRVLRGETLDAVSRELGVTAAKLAEWRLSVLTAAEAKLGQQPQESLAAAEKRVLQAKIGELLMDKELLEQKVDALESSRPLARPRSKP